MGWLMLAQAFLAQHNVFDAKNCLQKAASLATEINDLFNCGKLLSACGDLKTAETCLKKILGQQPGHFAALYHLGHIFFQAERLDESETTYLNALNLYPNQPDLLNAIGIVYHANGKANKATAVLKQANSVRPGNIETLLNLAESLRQQGHLAQAEDCYRSALKVDPENGHIWHCLSDTKRFRTQKDPDISVMGKLIEKPDIKDNDRIYLAYALAKALDQCKLPDKAFPFMMLANRLNRATYQYNLEDDLAVFSAIKERFNTETLCKGLEKSDQKNGPRPVFIVGMPRSGTTLTERILAAHPDVLACGERHDLQKSIEDVLSTNGNRETASAQAVSFQQHQLKNIARNYIDRLASHKSEFSIFTNKLPFNFLYIGWITLLFPDAVIIHCRRNALDTCLSIFQRPFPSLRAFTSNLEELGKYYREYDALMSHWNQVLIPGMMVDIHYEDLIADQENITRKILKHCKLEWEEKCLHFHDNPGIVNTASFEQVRRPLFNHSVNRSEAYLKHLGTLQNILGRSKQIDG